MGRIVRMYFIMLRNEYIDDGFEILKWAFTNKDKAISAARFYNEGAERRRELWKLYKRRQKNTGYDDGDDEYSDDELEHILRYKSDCYREARIFEIRVSTHNVKRKLSSTVI